MMAAEAPGALVLRRSHQELATKARSFRWAARFLPAGARDDAALLYALCRRIDDLADDAGQTPARKDAALLQLRQGLGGELSCLPAEDAALLAAVRELSLRRGVPLAAIGQLIDGVRGDLGPVRLADDVALLRYCYQVAGTVGVMMCGVLGVRSPAAWAYAMDLGIAMQITNICRDVKEDAALDRVYVPASRLCAAGVTQQEVLAGRASRPALGHVVAGLLDLADRYYESAEAGMRLIPARARLAIFIAGRLYRAIGLRVRKRLRCDPFEGRAVVPPLCKLGWVLRAGSGWLWSLAPGRQRGHDPALHRPLCGLLLRSPQA